MKTPKEKQLQQPVRFMFDAALLYKETCPELSRFFMQWPVKAMSKQMSSSLSQDISACHYCYQWLQPDNHRIRLRPKKRPSARVQRVLRRQAQGRRLSLMQKRLLHCFLKSSSVQMATCHACSKTSRHKGVSRDFIATLAKPHSTPGSTSKHKTPQSTSKSHTTTPKAPGKDRTPAHTPRCSTSSNASESGSSSSKSSSKPKNWVVQRLSKILMRESNQGSKKGGLKDFLSSL